MASKKQSFAQDPAAIVAGMSKKKDRAPVKTIAEGPAAAPAYKKPDPMKVINLRIPESLRARAELQAMQNGVTLSRYIRELIESAVDAAELQK